MWLITNEKNRKMLNVFEKKVIYPFFIELLHCKNIGFTLGFKNYIRDKSNFSIPANQDIFKIIGNRRIEKIKFIDYMDNILSAHSEAAIRHYFALFIFQNRQLNQRQKEIYYETIPDDFVLIFNKFFYEKFFNDDKICNLIYGIPYTRKIFHENFKSENDLFVCPYCDIDTTNNIGNNQIEHFWPKSKYPFLSMNALNLISSCPSCNMPFEGKGANYKIPITTPFIEQIGDSVTFQLDSLNKKLCINSSITEVKNYISLLQLKKRYESIQIYDYLIKRGESLYSSLLDFEKINNTLISSSDIIDIIKKAKANDMKCIPLYFATIDIFKDFDTYNAVRNK